MRVSLSLTINKSCDLGLTLEILGFIITGKFKLYKASSISSIVLSVSKKTDFGISINFELLSNNDCFERYLIMNYFLHITSRIASKSL